MIRSQEDIPYFQSVAKRESSYAVLGIGGELKNAFLPEGLRGFFYPSPYIGDMVISEKCEST